MQKQNAAKPAARIQDDGTMVGRTEPPAGIQPTPPPSPMHFSGLNTLRFYAAISVVIAHVSHNFGNIRTLSADIPLLNFLTLDSQSAVNLFLVLSGFLITYWMFQECAATGRFDTGRFYIRRALRIGPLYYLVVTAGIFLIPLVIGPSFEWPPLPYPKVILVLLFFPNFVTGLGPLEHIWCIGLESQFYLIWPWVLRQPIGGYLRIILGIILVKIMLTPAIAFLNEDTVTNLFLGLRFESLALGSAAAYLYFTRSPLLRYLCGLPMRWAIVGTMAGFALFDLPFTEPAILGSSVVFALLILNVCSKPGIGRKLEIPLLDNLGKISYGIYMYHYPLLYLCIKGLYRLGIPEGPAYTALLHTITISSTLLLACFSYRFFEQPFRRLGNRFSVLPTHA